MTHTNKISYFASFSALNHLILQISSSKTILFCIFLWVMLVLVDLRVLEEEGENRDGRWSNLNKQHFLLAGSWVGLRSVFSRSSLGGRGQGIREVNEKENLKKSAFCASASCVAKARWWQRSCSSGSRSERGERKARNTRRNIAEHRTSIGSNKCICWADAAIEKRRNVLADDSRSASRSQWMTLASLGDCCFRSPQKLKICGDPIYRITRSERRNFSPTRTEWADFEESEI